MKSILLFASMLSLSRAVSCPSGYQYEGGMGTCIGLPSNERGARDANEEICKSNGGHLVKIKSTFDNNVVQAWFRRVFPNTSVGQLGLKRTNGTWTWMDGSSITGYTYWGSGEPSAAGNCAYMYTRDGELPKWYAYPCDQKYYGLCESPAMACPEHWTYFPGTGKCYFQGRNATMDQAKQFCASKGGAVASIHSAAENAFVLDLIHTDTCYGPYYGNGFYPTYVILGGYMYGQTAGLWWDNTQFDYSPPNSYAYLPPSTTPVIYMDGAPTPCNGWNGRWVTTSSSLPSTFIFPGYLCKAPTLPTTP